MRRFAWMMLLALTLGCGGGGTPKAPATYQVEYLVSGATYDASLTYENETGGTNQEKIDSTWSKKFEAKPGQYLAVSAQKGDREKTALKVEIKVNGKVEASASSNDEFGIASANTSIPR